MARHVGPRCPVRRLHATRCDRGVGCSPGLTFIQRCERPSGESRLRPCRFTVPDARTIRFSNRADLDARGAVAPRLRHRGPRLRPSLLAPFFPWRRSVCPRHDHVQVRSQLSSRPTCIWKATSGAFLARQDSGPRLDPFRLTHQAREKCREEGATMKIRICGLTIVASILLIGSAVAKADVVLDWNAIAADTAVANGQSPFAQARSTAIVQLAVFEAVNAISRRLQAISWDHHGAARRISRSRRDRRCASRVGYIFPGERFDVRHDARKSPGLDSRRPGEVDGIATGEAAAAPMLLLRANDGSAPPQFKTPGPAVPGEWQATPSCPLANGVAVGVFFHWQNVTPFGISSVQPFLLDPPPALTSRRFSKGYNEVMTVGSLTSSPAPHKTGLMSYFSTQISSPALCAQSGCPASC